MSRIGPRPKNSDFPLPKVLLPGHHDGDSPVLAVRQMTAFSAKQLSQQSYKADGSRCRPRSRTCSTTRR